VAAICRDELLSSDDAPEVLYRDAVRHVPQIEAAAGDPQAPTIGFRIGGAYLLVGGLGEVGCAIAERLAREYRARIAIIGRSDPRGPALERLHRLREAGIQVHYEACDLNDRLGLERVSVCGLSIGGAVATWIAANAGDRVDRLVIGSAGPRFATPETWVDRAATVRAEGTEAVVDGVLERWFTPAFAAAHPDVVARFRAAFCAVNREGYAGCCDALAQWDATPHLRRVFAPTLVISGADDTVAPPDRGQELADGIPDARLVVLEDCAHLASANQPNAFADAVLLHLAGETG